MSPRVPTYQEDLSTNYWAWGVHTDMEHDANGMCAKHRGCTRGECVTARRRADALAANRRRLGYYEMVDVTPYRARLLRLRASGHTWEQLSSATGLPQRQLGRIMGSVKPASKRIMRKTARKVDRMMLGPSSGPVPSYGAVRRLRALAAIGWSAEDLAGCLLAQGGWRTDRLVSGMRWVSDVRTERFPVISAARDRAVRKVYDDLSMTPGRSHKARDWARRQGWAPPLAWDDEALDDPCGAPEGY